MIAPTMKTALVACLVLVLFTAFAVHAQEVARMSKEELKAEMGKPGLVVLDVRADHDWDSSQWKINGAVREEPGKVEQWLGKYPKDAKYVLYCA